MTVSESPSVTDAATLPPVVAVVVAHDPGDWFEDTLRSLAHQTYTNLAVLVIDAESSAPLAARIAAVLPGAHERRLEQVSGFGAACNEVLTAVEGAAFYLLCHDDVRLEPDAVQVMVEEAFRSNAGIVGPKLVHWDDVDHLLDVGMGVDKVGQPLPLLEPGELDQSQHDLVREVFWISGAVTLVRADLFAALGGFDPGIDYLSDDLDLCWRARVAGARVIVAPAARVAHLEALGVRRPVDDRRRLQMRHRLRTVLVCYTPLQRLRVLPQAAALTVAEMVYAVVLGRFRHAGDVGGAWWWNLRHHGQVRQHRKALSAVRTTPDAAIRDVQVRGSARINGFLRGRIGRTDDRVTALAGVGKVADNLRSSNVRSALIAWGGVLALFLVGSRQLIIGPLPAVGDFAAFPSGASDLFADWLRYERDIGVGIEAASPPAIGVFGIVSVLTLGFTSLARTILILGALPLGAIGAWRLARPIGSRRARIAALVVFVANPLPYNALAQGHWGALVLCACSPWLLLQLARASRVTPFGADGGPAGPGAPDRPLVQHIVALGLLTAIVGLWFPAVSIVLVGMAAALAVGGALTGSVAGAGRTVAAGVGGAVLGLILLLPWSASLLGAPLDVVLGASAGGVPDLDIGAMLRFQTGPIGASVLGWGLLVGASLSLLIGRAWRLGWAARGWTVALASWSVLIAVTLGAVSDALALPVAEAVLAPALAGLTLAAAMGMAAFEVDLPDYHFGWRQVASLLAAACVALTLLPVLGSAAGGRWDLPQRDVAEKVSFTAEQRSQAAFRILWVGDPAVLPLAGWHLDAPTIAADDDALVFGLSDGGAPTIDDQWLAIAPTSVELLETALQDAANGSTQRLGELLGPFGIRYVVVPDQLGPEASAAPEAGAGQLVDLLRRQLDLSPVSTGAGLQMFENSAWSSSRSALPAEPVLPAAIDGQPRPVPELAAGEPVVAGVGVEPASGPIPGPGQVFVATQSSPNWALTVDGTPIPRQDALGWAMAFPDAGPGRAELTYTTPPGRRLLAGATLVLWAAAIVFLLRTRVARDERRDLEPGPVTS